MNPLAFTGLATAVIPFVTAGVKRLFTKNLPESDTKTGVHALIPIVLGILSAGLYTYVQTHDAWQALAAGLGSGGAASSVRDIDKNLTGIVESLYKLVKKDGTGK